jgi:hypothetical protein
MPRRSIADLAVPRVDGRPSRLTPPPSLSADARAAFQEIVGSVEPEHFKPADVPLICRLAAAHLWASRAEDELERIGAVVDGKLSPWATLLEKQNGAIRSLSTALRLTPQSRYDARAAARSATVHTGPVPWET